MLRRRTLCFLFILVTCCSALLTACTRITSVPGPIDKLAATVTPTEDQSDSAVPPNPAVATATPSLPDEVGGLELVGYLGSGPIRALSIQGDLAYIGLGRMLEIVRLADPARQERVGYVVLPGDVLDVAVREAVSGRAYAYVAVWRGGLYVVDVTNPDQPLVVGTHYVSTHVTAVAVSGVHLYVSAGALRVMDLGDPASPTEVGAYQPADPMGNAGKVVAVTDEYAYVTFGGGSSKEGSLRLAEGEHGDVRAYGLAVDGNYAYLAVGSAGLRVVDVSDPLAPVEVSVLDVPGRADNLVVVDDRVYLVDGDLRIVDVSDPTWPREIGFHDVPNLSAWPYVAVEGRHAYLTTRGTVILDVSGPGASVEVASYPLAQGHVAVANGMVYVTGDGLCILRPRALTEAAVSPTATPKPECETYTASAGFEFHSGYPGPAPWVSESSGPLNITAMSPEPELVPEGAFWHGG